MGSSGQDLSRRLGTEQVLRFIAILAVVDVSIEQALSVGFTRISSVGKDELNFAILVDACVTIFA
jgi:hypothetical protein